MELLKLYKKHINADPDGSEIHEFFSRFDIGMVVYYPEQEPWIDLNKEIRIREEIKKTSAMEWIFKNSKL